MAQIRNCRVITEIHGSLSERDRVYFRILNGKQIAQRKPDRSRHKPTEGEQANRRRFAKEWGGHR